MNKKLTIFLIILFSIIAISLIIFMILLLNGKIKMTKFPFGHKISDELILNETYENKFNDISITAQASDIYIKKSSEENVKVVIYGDKENTKVDVLENKLLINSKTKSCVGFCFNTTISKIEVYLPENYENNIKINNNYGDINISKFLKATLDIEEDCGDVNVLGGNFVTIDNHYGDVIVDEANVVDIKQSAGDVKVEKVNDAIIKNKYGDIEIDTVNNYLDLTNNCGDIEIDNINLTKNSTIKDDLGDIKIGKTNKIYIDAKTKLGDVKINDNYKKSDVSLEIENSCGDIKVDN